ncbi:SGNH/GDSL hydrolase family protein [Fodinicola acaciae]|uniref:SGNH/GDSL hydrolase family protein n=1 Tax=Fodinicola acaciae TaxID=2681555 RepID=UPI0013D6E8C2|nr:SGNH/GDSL hydrolase family protein [Fodinicola acaciae]
MRLARWSAAVLVAAALVAPAPASAAPTWTGSWAAAPAAGDPGLQGRGYPGYSLRNELHLSVGGSQLRIHFSNAWGTGALPLDHATVAVSTGAASPAARAGSMRTLTFNGQAKTTIAKGGETVSDPVPMAVGAGTNLLVTTYVSADAGPVTFHSDARQTSYFTSDGTDHSAEESAAAYTQATGSWYYVNEVDVRGGPPNSVVALGDSITDGALSTPNTNSRWPDRLAARLNQRPAPQRHGVMNAGIGGNCILADGTRPGGPGAWAGEKALARLDRDVLDRTGVRTVIVVEGINDIGQNTRVSDPQLLIDGLTQIAQRAHARGLRVIGGTMTPAPNYTGDLEYVREAVNQWVRTTHVFDGVADFDKAVRDPQDPHRMLPAYDSGDHLHPGDAGYQAMADAVPIAAL